MNPNEDRFSQDFASLTGFAPFAWQRRLFEALSVGQIPASLDLPTGLGKTSTMAIWLLARAHGAPLPRRLAYVVDRRAVVDQATEEAERLRSNLEQLPRLKTTLGLSENKALPISTLRGQFIDNRQWLVDPSAPAIVVGTVDMIGSRLLFSGYGVSRRMRPYHAGLLGADCLVLLDEAHLVPPFEKLLERIEDGQADLGPADGVRHTPVPRLRLLSLSATGRARAGQAFTLAPADRADVEHRLGARKRLNFQTAGDTDLSSALADAAWNLSSQGKPGVRCIIYCDSRADAERTELALRERAAGDRKRGIAPVAITTELFVGARRVRERDAARQWLGEHGFLAGGSAPRCAAFLVATSAGEVGVDLDADHMTCDLVPWERMVQRLGRVNRRGMGDARIIVVEKGEPKAKKPEKPTEQEKRAAISWRAKIVLESLPLEPDGFDASPRALVELKSRASRNVALAEQLEAATTPAPLRPALTRSVVDAWAMTSLEQHAGRPEITPWLRGWIEDDEPQCQVLWRRWLPVRHGENVPTEEVEAFFEAAPPHASEMLETEAWRVAEWILDRVRRCAAIKEPDRPAASDVVALVLSDAREVMRDRDGSPLIFTLGELASSDGKSVGQRAKRLVRSFSGGILVVDARLGGLGAKGMLALDIDAPPPTTDDVETEWLPPDMDGRPATQFRIRANLATDAAEPGSRNAVAFVAKLSDEGQARLIHLIETWTTEESRATATTPQLLDEHQDWTAAEAARIARALGLHADLEQALTLAARLHDEGKRARRWQQAFNAPRDGIYAKTRGPVRPALLDGYRHEFGSLPRVEADPAFKGLVSPELRDLVLHLVAAHHGFARPTIGTSGCEEAPPTALARRAQHVALRFARLQERWGPWGLAWLESLMRAADQRVSRRNDERSGVVNG
jgi:CRISPR-associated endonuclease/helicase Cas3